MQLLQIFLNYIMSHFVIKVHKCLLESIYQLMEEIDPETSNIHYKY